MAGSTSGVQVVIIGGVSVNDPGGHDKFPYNFINPGVRRAIAFKGNAEAIFYAPAYDKTDFETIGQGQTFPKSAGGCQEYPAPTLGRDGVTWTYPPRRPLADPF